MGIPRLSGYLDGFGVSVLFGCRHVECSLRDCRPKGRGGVVIDGPSLVHHVYNKLLTEYSSRADLFDAVLQYTKVGDAVIEFLEYLESLHIPM